MGTTIKPDIFDDEFGDWRQKLALIVEAMREMSRQTDPQAMVRAYRARMRQILPTDCSVSLSRRDLESPLYRITRATVWHDDVNPWSDPDRLPVLQGGLFGELIYGDEPRIIDDLRLAPDDPATPYLAGQRSLMAIPLFDRGVALNMVVLGRREPRDFRRQDFAEIVWMSNLFGRATHNLVLSEEVKKAYGDLDDELRIVADIQRSLLPAELPRIPTMDLAAHYRTSRRAGGDYYDFFPLPDGHWGILIADVSGHGTPAAVVMAITHTVAHTHPGPPMPPGAMLGHVNQYLANHRAARSGTFVTAFYGIYNPAARELVYACAGHNPPLLKRCADGTRATLDGVRQLPLGIAPAETYLEHRQVLQPGDQIVFYTDGVTEAESPAGEMFGMDRLSQALQCCATEAADVLSGVLESLHQFTAGRPPGDDQTLLVAKIR